MQHNMHYLFTVSVSVVAMIMVGCSRDCGVIIEHYSEHRRLYLVAEFYSGLDGRGVRPILED